MPDPRKKQKKKKSAIKAIASNKKVLSCRGNDAEYTYIYIQYIPPVANAVNGTTN